MTIQQVHIKDDFKESQVKGLAALDPNLIIAFGDSRYFKDLTLGRRLRTVFPKAILIGASTAGEIVDGEVYDNTLIITAVSLNNVTFTLASAQLTSAGGSYQAGQQLGEDLKRQAINAAFLLSPGLDVNGSDLLAGLNAALPDGVVVTGGLAGDAARFKETYTLGNEIVSARTIVALGIVGTAYSYHYGSEGGWTPFGPNRRVTKARDNILYEIDGKSALQLYKEYLGEKAKELPASGLLYPLAVVDQDNSMSVIRTILNIDEVAGSLILAGSIAEGVEVRLMHAKTEGLIAGARLAGESAQKVGSSVPAELGLLVSCVGRKLIMGDDVDEEVFAVKQALGTQTIITGFYSYGEISPNIKKSKKALLHNQTMTVTSLYRET